VELTKGRAEAFYGEHKGRPFFAGLVEFMTSGPIWALVLTKPGAIKAWRALMGPTSTEKAKAEAPDTLRALFGTDGTQNATHGSDSPASASREIGFYFPNVAFADPVEDFTGLAVEQTLALIKPDATGRDGDAREIMALISLAGFTIVAQQQIKLTRDRAEAFYGEHKGKPFFEGLVAFMTSGPLTALVLAKPGAIKAWRSMMGPTSTDKARAEAPRSLRALYGTDGTRNATHGSDSPASAAREIRFFFPAVALNAGAPATAEEASAAIDAQLKTVLVAGLTYLAKNKLASSEAEAVKQLGRYLLDHNPNGPRVHLPGQAPPDAHDAVEIVLPQAMAARRVKVILTQAPEDAQQLQLQLRLPLERLPLRAAEAKQEASH